MLFSSVVFLFYFLPAVLVLYYMFSFSKVMKNMLLLAASLFFYAWGEPVFVVIMLLSILFNYLFAIFIDKYRENKIIVRVILMLMLTENIGLLFVFKYLDFILSNLNQSFGSNLTLTGLTLPIGISFFTFQAISYVIDVYRGNGEVQKNPFYVALYISFFPQLVAGPIVRYSTVADQIQHRREDYTKFSIGCCRFITGLGKKIILANNMAIVADRVFEMNSISQVSVSLAWLGSIAYTLQIFFDFSGYSDMAVGLGLMFGFQFEENFNYPYISKSIGEFWRRWHISLGTWFKEYVYFPLGGSRVANKDIMIRNLLIVWALTGIWHGAEWTFLIWGLMNFLWIAFEKFTSFEQLGESGNRRWMCLKWLYTMLIVNFGWVIFRSGNLIEAGKYYSSMFGMGKNSFFCDTTVMFLKEYGLFFAAGILFCTPFAKRINTRIVLKNKKTKILNLCYPAGMMLLFFICISYLVKETYNPFIYFNF